MAIRDLTTLSIRRLAGFGVALSLANLLMLSLWDEFQDPSFDYFRDVPFITWTSYGTAALELLALGTVLWALFTAISRTRQPVLRRMGCGLALLLAMAALDVSRVYVFRIYYGNLLDSVSRSMVLVILGVLACAMLWLVLFHDRVTLRIIRGALLAALPLLPINLAAGAWAVHRSAHQEKFRPARPLPLVASPHSTPRFIWIIFDEWDYERTFVRRPEDLALPELDRFQAQALHAEAVSSPAKDTQESIPSLITGRPVTKVGRVSPDDLILTFADAPDPLRWSANSNVFRQAREMGINCAVTGFYHAYQRVLGQDLVDSSSTSLWTYEEPAYWTGGWGLRNLYHTAQLPLYRVPLLKRSGILGGWREREALRIAYQRTMSSARHLVARPEIGLVLLHLPVPHPPAYYDRKSGLINSEIPGTYEDGLALLDRTLQELRTTMEAAGQWEGSFVLITTDHPLRAEPRDPRIPFLLKAPGQHTGRPYTAPFNSILSSDLIRAALRGDVRSAGEVEQWLDQHRLNYLPGPGLAPATMAEATN